MIADCPIVSQEHALLRPGLCITAEIVDAAHMAALRGEITLAEFRAAHGDEAGDRLARAMGEVGRG